MSTRYLPILAEVVTQLQAISPTRLVTRNWTDFANRPPADLARGVWIVRSGRIGPYPYETSDHGGATDGLRATENGRMHITIVGQLELPPGATGEDVDAAEFQMIHELEQLADAAIETDLLCALLLKDVQMSQQIEAPYAWVASTWEVFAL